MDPKHIKELMTRLIKRYGIPKPGLGAVEIKALMRIPKPPMAYIELKCTLHGTEGEERDIARKNFIRRLPDFMGEIKEYQNKLAAVNKHNVAYAEYALVRGSVHYIGDQGDFTPIGYIHDRHDQDRWGLLVDFDFYRDGVGKLKKTNIYIDLYPERFFDRQLQVVPTTVVDQPVEAA